MRRALPWVLFAFAALAAAQGSHAARWVYDPPRRLGCGNVVSEPYRVVVRYVAPLAGLAAVVLIRLCLRARRWSLLAVTGLLAFVAAAAGLRFEGWWLETRYGFECLDAAWWLPRR